MLPLPQGSSLGTVKANAGGLIPGPSEELGLHHHLGRRLLASGTDSSPSAWDSLAFVMDSSALGHRPFNLQRVTLSAGSLVRLWG